MTVRAAVLLVLLAGVGVSGCYRVSAGSQGMAWRVNVLTGEVCVYRNFSAGSLTKDCD